MARIYKGFTETLLANKFDTKNGEHTNNMIDANMPKNKL